SSAAEREAFEKWCKETGLIDRMSNGPFRYSGVDHAWAGWQACAALTPSPAAETERREKNLRAGYSEICGLARQILTVVDRGALDPEPTPAPAGVDAVEVAAKAAFRQAQTIYRGVYDYIPLNNTWERADGTTRECWRKIAKAALGIPDLSEQGSDK
ncbi:hypothetical protein, partial [Roseixanthobacter glucoisosaccharinicivorans]|uniref:hypothetical protein n=1 Tax=Roseixanthobacter glucoisosaccharinicivorans TaxID=3119923 RepID=UPI00372B4913